MGEVPLYVLDLSRYQHVPPPTSVLYADPVYERAHSTISSRNTTPVLLGLFEMKDTHRLGPYGSSVPRCIGPS